jgi:hypothetical protein
MGDGLALVVAHQAGRGPARGAGQIHQAGVRRLREIAAVARVDQVILGFHQRGAGDREELRVLA